MDDVKTVTDAWRLHREKRPDHIALMCGEKTRTWKEFDERANQIANALLALGVKRKDRIGVYVLFAKSVEFIEVFYAAMKLAAIPFYVNFRYTPREIVPVIEDVDASFLFLEDGLVPRIQEIKGNLKIKKYIVIGEEKNVPEGMIHFESLLQKQPKTPPRFDWEPPRPEDIAWLQHTTGTTGNPKGTILTHESLIHTMTKVLPLIYILLAGKWDKAPETLNIKKEAMQKGWHPMRVVQKLSYGGMNLDTLTDVYGERIFFSLPPTSTAAGIDHSGLYLTAGAAVAFPSEFEPGQICATIERRKITDILVAGDVITLPLLNELKKGKYDTSSIVGTYSTGVKLSKNLKKEWLDLVPTTFIFDALSTTEAWYNSGNVTFPGEEPEEGVFTPFSPRTLAILNDKGQLVEEGEVGEIVVPKYASEGYYNDPKKSAQTFKNIRMPFQDAESVWVFTSDYATYDKEGRVILKGRGAEVIDTGGLKVFTPEVRDFIAQNPKVQDVAVIGTPHERFTSAITAIIETKEGESLTEKEIIDYCRQGLADFKIPKRVVFAKVPRDTMGKIPIPEAIKLAKRELGIKD